MQTIPYNNRLLNALQHVQPSRIFSTANLYRFVRRNADAFEAYARTGTPFGGSVRRH